MRLREAQTLLSQIPQGPKTAADALHEITLGVSRAEDYLSHGNTVQAQAHLEHAFTALLIAFRYLNIDLEQVVSREMQRNEHQDKQGQDRVILIFSDHAELRVDGELRGKIPLYQPEDYRELQHIAQLFKCRIEQTDHLQLSLLSAGPVT